MKAKGLPAPAHQYSFRGCQVNKSQQGEPHSSPCKVYSSSSSPHGSGMVFS